MSCCWLKPKGHTYTSLCLYYTDDTLPQVESWHNQYSNNPWVKQACVKEPFGGTRNQQRPRTLLPGQENQTQLKFRDKEQQCVYRVSPAESQATRWAGHTGSSYDQRCVALKQNEVFMTALPHHVDRAKQWVSIWRNDHKKTCIDTWLEIEANRKAIAPLISHNLKTKIIYFYSSWPKRMPSIWLWLVTHLQCWNKYLVLSVLKVLSCLQIVQY